MKLLYVIVAGLAGTAAMTAFLYLLSFFTHRVMKMIRIMGTMIMNRTQPDGSLSDASSTKVVGTIVIYLMGVLFALMYLAIWDADIGLITASWGLFLGLANGIVAMVIWYFFFMLHPRPHLISLKTYLLTLIAAHVVFGFVVTFTYYLFLQPDYEFWW